MNNNYWDPRLTDAQLEDARDREIYEPTGPEYEQFLSNLGYNKDDKVIPNIFVINEEATKANTENKIVVDIDNTNFNVTLSQVAKEIYNKRFICAFNGFLIDGTKYNSFDAVIDAYIEFRENKKKEKQEKQEKQEAPNNNIDESTLNDNYKVVDHDGDKPVIFADGSLSIQEVAATLAGKNCTCRYKEYAFDCSIYKSVVEMTLDFYTRQHQTQMAVQEAERIQKEAEKIIAEKEEAERKEQEKLAAENAKKEAEEKKERDIFERQLNELNKFIDNLEIPPHFKTNLRHPIGELRIYIGDFASRKDEILRNYENIVKEVLDSYSITTMDFHFHQLNNVRYAIDRDEYANILNVYNQYNESTSVLDKYEMAKNFESQYKSIIASLDSKKILKNGEINISKDKRFGFIKKITGGDRTENFSKNALAIQSILDRVEDLAAAYRSETNPDRRKSLMKDINKCLKSINSLNRKITSLKNKNGSIAPHQRVLMVKVEAVERSLNQNTLNYELPHFEFSNKLEDLREAYVQNKLDNNRHTRKQVAKCEKALYGYALTKIKKKQLENRLFERRKIIDNATKNVNGNDRKARNNYKSTIKKLRRIDRQIIGRRNTKAIYKNLLEKTGYIVGGTKLALPSELVNLDMELRRVRV